MHDLSIHFLFMTKSRFTHARHPDMHPEEDCNLAELSVEPVERFGNVVGRQLTPNYGLSPGHDSTACDTAVSVHRVDRTTHAGLVPALAAGARHSVATAVGAGVAHATFSAAAQHLGQRAEPCPGVDADFESLLKGLLVSPCEISP